MSISTITACHGRTALVELLLQSLQASRRAFPGNSESIIIDSSAPHDGEHIAQLCHQYGARYLQGPVSVREKRNQGIASASYDVLLFIDSDCEAEPQLLAQHHAGYEDNPAIAGVLGLTKFKGRQTWVWSVLPHTTMLDGFSFAEKYPYAQWGPCANLSLRKAVVDEVGGFQTDLPCRLGGDDLDLTLRITERGYLIRCNRGAVVWHATETWNRLRALIERSWRWGRMEYYHLRFHPQLEYHDAPKPLVVFLFCLLVAVLFAPFRGASLICIAASWILVFVAIDLSLRIVDRSARLSLGLLVAECLALLYEGGAMFEFVRHRDFRFAYKRLVFAPAQITVGWDRQIGRTWAILLATALLLLAFLL